MRDTSKVYPWGDFVSFIRTTYELNSDVWSHPVLDQVAVNIPSFIIHATALKTAGRGQSKRSTNAPTFVGPCGS
jgi:hypothetical protein